MKIKKILNLIWSEFVYGGHLTSVASASVVFTAAVLLNIRIGWDFLLVVYLGTHSVYLFNRYKEFKNDTLTNLKRAKHIRKYVKFIPLIIFLFTCMAIGLVVFFSKIPALIFGLLMLFLGFLYTLIFKRITQKLLAFKSFLISLIWTLLVIFLLIYYSSPLNLALFLVLIFIYLRLFIHTTFFDIKDIKSDKKEGLSTLAIVLGKERLIHFLNFINIFSMIPLLFGSYLNLLPKFSLILFLTVIASFYYLQELKDRKINIAYFSQLAISGEKILWSFLILISKSLS